MFVRSFVLFICYSFDETKVIIKLKTFVQNLRCTLNFHLFTYHLSLVTQNTTLEVVVLGKID